MQVNRWEHTSEKKQNNFYVTEKNTWRKINVENCHKNNKYASGLSQYHLTEIWMFQIEKARTNEKQSGKVKGGNLWIDL